MVFPRINFSVSCVLVAFLARRGQREWEGARRAYRMLQATPPTKISGQGVWPHLASALRTTHLIGSELRNPASGRHVEQREPGAWGFIVLLLWWGSCSTRGVGRPTPFLSQAFTRLYTHPGSWSLCRQNRFALRPPVLGSDLKTASPLPSLHLHSDPSPFLGFPRPVFLEQVWVYQPPSQAVGRGKFQPHPGLETPPLPGREGQALQDPRCNSRNSVQQLVTAFPSALPLVPQLAPHQKL